MPTRMLTVPRASPVRLAIPWWNTSHGPRPRPDAAITAMPTPKIDEARHEAREAAKDGPADEALTHRAIVAARVAS